jgi:hypothetical protein
MRLAAALEDLANQGLLGAVAADARAASLANLGVLLGESGLGVPFSLAPIWTSPEQAADARAVLAHEAGLPGTPDLSLPIFLPAARGVPILERGTGFIARDAEITPAAVGWTLAREAQFLDASGGARGGLGGYLAGFVEIALDGQLAWLNDVAGSSGDDALVHGAGPTVAGARRLRSSTPAASTTKRRLARTAEAALQHRRGRSR